MGLYHIRIGLFISTLSALSFLFQAGESRKVWRLYSGQAFSPVGIAAFSAVTWEEMVFKIGIWGDKDWANVQYNRVQGYGAPQLGRSALPTG